MLSLSAKVVPLVLGTLLVLFDGQSTTAANHRIFQRCGCPTTSRGPCWRLWRIRYVPRCSASQSTGCNCGARVVRYDGVYQSTTHDLPPHYWSYLRFYEDGTVLAVESFGTPAQIARWFNRQQYSFDKGVYSIAGTHITFSATSSEETVDYDGTIIEEGKVKLNEHSHINDNRFTETYRFVEQKMSSD